MTWWMNLHNVPDGKSMFVVYVTMNPEGTPREDVCAEEIDLVLPTSYGRDDIIKSDELKKELDDYDPGMRVVGITNESEGFVVYDALA